MNLATFKSLGMALSITLFSGSALAGNTLLEEITAADTELFSAFNACDVEAISTIYSPDLEFYHDVSGLQGYQASIEATRQLCSRDLGLVRTPVEGSFEVFPVKDFGAMHIGEHTFCHERNGVEDCGTFSFAHVWKQTDGGWRLHRVLSFGH
ncbi:MULTISPECIES: nuclear transport factor 2 family protein [Gammaproteobacteria]|uniref:nuclear transport factor 2 family protein n=1 Tax=Gammaproteobacteria TaxID=1236 RepID=UPI000DD06C52|nr:MULTISPECIES: nuclear transport factor 2 family protein [Gammaproteobacteria]RTE85489.1 nuclear transport factor 2 family protein [Aliidiomarina sp. B3213]TCZ89457.1 nuclear transport factor 2 family protein [Lysobacter sp. N42]